MTFVAAKNFYSIGHRMPNPVIAVVAETGMCTKAKILGLLRIAGGLSAQSVVPVAAVEQITGDVTNAAGWVWAIRVDIELDRPVLESSIELVIS